MIEFALSPRILDIFVVPCRAARDFVSQKKHKNDKECQGFTGTLARLSLAISQLICERVEDCATVWWFFLRSIGISRIHGKPKFDC